VSYLAKFYLFINGKILLDEKHNLPENVSRLEKYIVNSGYVDRQVPDGDQWAELAPGTNVPDGWKLRERRGLWPEVSEPEFFRVGKAFHLMDWQRTHRFCGVCGARMEFDAVESALRCPECGDIEFPVIAPAVIVAVERDGKLLMGHNVNFPDGRYSVLAGFVESGETLEQCIRREIYEEAKIKVKNIKYFGSQPWAFPRSLMLGFTAKWADGEVVADQSELGDVQWFAPDEMPDRPEGVSISAKLIDDFIRRHTKK
jgi:NAD+ diphosphatase